MLFSYWGFTLIEKKMERNLKAFYYGVTYLFLISFLPPVFLVMIYEALYIKLLKKLNAFTTLSDWTFGFLSLVVI